MPSERTQRFIEALTTMEAIQDPGLLVPLFTEQAELSSLAHAHTFKGREAAQTFWQGYLDVFDTVGSEFTTVMEQGPLAVLEWTSQGVLRSGIPVSYRGVSVLRYADDGSVERFSTFYDTTPFTAQVAHKGTVSQPEASQAVS